MAIVVGNAATNRTSRIKLYDAGVAWTAIEHNTAANENGTVTVVEAWYEVAVSGNFVRVGSFHDDGADSYSCHDAEDIGQVVAGSKQTYTGLSVDFLAGEFIGEDGDIQNVKIECDNAGGVGGAFYKIGWRGCFIGSSNTYTQISAGYKMSLYGYEPTGWAGKIAGVSSPAAVAGVLVANIAEVKGVA